MEALADLHTHTTHSDGHNSPLELLQKAKAAGISILGIADHDSVGALDEATELGRAMGIEVIPAMFDSIDERGDPWGHPFVVFSNFPSTTTPAFVALAISLPSRSSAIFLRMSFRIRL